jgi:hypothetical protein
VFYFDDLTVQFLKELPVFYMGKSYEELLRQQDRAGIVALKQLVWDGIRKVSPSLYTDYMANKLATTVFTKGIKTSTKVTEAVIGDVRSEDQARWLQRFGIDKHNRKNKMVLIPGDPLPSPLGDHPSEKLTWSPDQTINLEVPLEKEVERIRRQFYVE